LLVTTVAALSLAVTLPFAAGASGSPTRASGTLQLHALFTGKWAGVACPAGTPVTTSCYLFTGDGVVPGLGRATETYTTLLNQADNCTHSTFTPVVIAVAGKGEIDGSLTDPYTPCDPPTSAPFTFNFAVSGGSGTYPDASGGGTGQDVIHETGTGTGTMVDTWAGQLTVAGHDFDTTPPTLSGAVSKTVGARKGAKRVRVTYTITAQDAVDGSVPVTCKPPTGSRFKIGRTRVVCSATDTSGNTATATFTVTVKRRRP
jgi:hypothetical protein